MGGFSYSSSAYYRLTNKATGNEASVRNDQSPIGRYTFAEKDDQSMTQYWQILSSCRPFTVHICTEFLSFFLCLNVLEYDRMRPYLSPLAPMPLASCLQDSLSCNSSQSWSLFPPWSDRGNEVRLLNQKWGFDLHLPTPSNSDKEISASEYSQSQQWIFTEVKKSAPMCAPCDVKVRYTHNSVYSEATFAIRLTSDQDSELECPAPANQTSSQNPKPESRPSVNQLSAGSAAFLVISMILGLLSQGTGCLFLTQDGKRAWRLASFKKHDVDQLYSTSDPLPLWRFSPFLCGLETILILLHLLRAPFQRVRLRVRCFELIQARENAFEDEQRRVSPRRPKIEVIIPLILQIWKVIFIRGASFTKAICTLYWTNWALVEILHLIVWLPPGTQSDVASSIAAGSRRAWTRIGILSCCLLPYILFTIASAPFKRLFPVSIVLLVLILGLLIRSYVQGHDVLNIVVIGAFILGDIYFGQLYNPKTTYRPSWLDWFG